MKLKYIYIITICFCYFSLKAKENKKSIIEDTPQLKKAFQSLYEKIKAPQNQKTDYLIDFGTANSVTASDLKNLAVNGGTSILDQNTQNEVITKLDYFNSVNGYGGKNNTKLFAFTGRIILGYSNVREFDYAGTSNTKSESTKDEELFKALQLGSQSKNLSSPLYDSTFVQTLDSEWSNFKNLSSPKKTMVCFFVEAILIRAKQIDGQVVSRNDTYTPEREIVKSYFVLVWQNGLDAFDWYKINNEENKAQLTITYNVQGGFTQQSEFPAFVQKMQDFLSSNLVLDTPEKAIKFVQKTYASEKSLLLNMSFDKRKDLLTTIDKASTLRDCTPSPNEVSEKCGENAVLKLFETTPEAQFNDMLTLLKLPSSNDPQKMLLVSLCKKMTDVGYGGNSYGTLMAYINSFALKAYPIDFSSQNWEQIRADRFVRIDEGEDVGDHINIIILDEKTGKIKVQRKLITYIKNISYSTLSDHSIGYTTYNDFITIKLSDLELDPFTLIFVTNQSHVSSIAEGGITNDVSGNYEGNTYSGCYTTAYSLTYIDQKFKNKQTTDALVVLGSVASIVSGPGAAAVAIQQANILKAGYVAFEMATCVGNIIDAMAGIDPNSLEGTVLGYANMICIFFGGYKGVVGSAKSIGNLPETIKNVSTNITTTTQKIGAMKSFLPAFDAAESSLSAKAIYPKLKGFRDVCFRVLKNAGEDTKLFASNLDNISDNYKKYSLYNTSMSKIKNGNVTSAKIINSSKSNFVNTTAEFAEQIPNETIILKNNNSLTSIDGFTAGEVSTLSSKSNNIIELYNNNSGYTKGTALGDDVYLFEGNTVPQPLPSVVNLPKGKIIPFYPKYPAKGFALAFVPNEVSLISKAVLLVASSEVARDILEEEKLKDCDICKEERKIYCPQAQLLLTKVGITYKLAIKKLCDNLSLANTVSVFNTLTGTGFSIAEAQAFLNNINELSINTNHICNKIPFIDIGVLNAWELVYQAAQTETKLSSNYQKDMALLLQVKNLQSNSNVLNALGGESGLTIILQKHYTAPCNTCTNNSGNIHQNYISEYLRDVEFFVDTYGTSTTNNVSAVLNSSGMKSGQIWQVRGTAYMVKAIYEENRKNLTYFEGSTIAGPPTKNGCLPDARQQVTTSTGTKNRIIEFKSWAKANLDADEEDADSKGNPSESSFENLAKFLYKDPTKANSYTQFRCYIYNINDIADLEYYFDARKGTVTESYVKEVFQRLLYDKTTKQLTVQGEEIFGLIWGNVTFRTNLFNNKPLSDAKKDFTDSISNTSNSFYRFIKVK